jgi:hypothetical protein
MDGAAIASFVEGAYQTPAAVAAGRRNCSAAGRRSRGAP